MLPDFQAASRIYLETAPLIYFIEQHPDFGSLVQPLIAAIDSGAKLGPGGLLPPPATPLKAGVFAAAPGALRQLPCSRKALILLEYL